jgi:hypothetical protein
MRLKLGKTGAHPELANIGERWRQKNPLLRLDSRARVIFLIPLISRNRSTSWGRVDENLALTLKSLIAQSNPNWEAWICGQDAPPCVSIDPRIRFIKYSENIQPDQISDKGPKMKLLRQRLFEAPPGDGYLFYLDADDILHPELVDYFLTRADESGYIIQSGYIMNYSTGVLGEYGRKTARHWRRRPFFLHCGSCSAIRVDRRSGRSFEAVLEERGKHGQQRERLAYFGLELAEVPFPAAIYMVNHGENLRMRRGKLDAKLRYLRKNILRPEEATAVLEEFGFERLRHGSV